MDSRKKRRNAASRKGYIVILLISIIAALLIGMSIGAALANRPDAATGPDATAVPTELPEVTEKPTEVPTTEPTEAPTAVPTEAPTEAPTAVPTEAPTEAPTAEPTVALTAVPTVAPTAESEAVPANPMEGQGDAEDSDKISVEDRRPLNHADRIREAHERGVLPLAGVRIGIDPGHQIKGNNDREPVAPGSSETKAKVSSGTQGVATRIPEYVVNLDVSLMLRDALEELGAEVFMTREVHEIDISNIERAVMMNEIGVDLVLRIHCNGSDNQNTKGISLFVKETGIGAEESYMASEALLPAMAEATGARAMGIYKRDTYSGLNWSEVPSILVEMGFMSNPEEDRLLCDPDYQQKLVDGMVQVLYQLS